MDPADGAGPRRALVAHGRPGPGGADPGAGLRPRRPVPLRGVGEGPLRARAPGPVQRPLPAHPHHDARHAPARYCRGRLPRRPPPQGWRHVEGDLRLPALPVRPRLQCPLLRPAVLPLPVVHHGRAVHLSGADAPHPGWVPAAAAAVPACRGGGCGGREWWRGGCHLPRRGGAPEPQRDAGAVPPGAAAVRAGAAGAAGEVHLVAGRQ
mmetsp:Transcript_70148/g.123669  ORF Transcript_70148/g.123669 Transcript_70148/m.123669 type:complete len:208 (+) Transcript_70148:4616-5239(+)